jgi:hypothetical protein
MNVQELEQKLAELEAQKVALFDGGNADQVAVSRINEQIRDVQAQLNVAKQQGAHEERMEQAQEKAASTIETIEVDGQTIPLRELASGEASYQLMLIHFNNALVGQAEQFSKQILTIEESHQNQLSAKTEIEGQLNFQNAQLQQKTADLTTALNKTEADKENSKAEAADFEQKLKNAAAEIDRLNSQVDDLRTEIAVGARNAVKVVDSNLTANLAEAARKYNESKPAIYDVQPTDTLRKVDFTAKFVETDEELTNKYIYIGKYRVLEGEELARFQAELEAKKQAEPVAPPVESDLAVTEEVIPVPDTFQEDAETSSGELAEHEPLQPDDGKGYVTRAEFEAFKQEVEDKIANVMGDVEVA